MVLQRQRCAGAAGNAPAAALAALLLAAGCAPELPYQRTGSLLLPHEAICGLAEWNGSLFVGLPMSDPKPLLEVSLDPLAIRARHPTFPSQSCVGHVAPDGSSLALVGIKGAAIATRRQAGLRVRSPLAVGAGDALPYGRRLYATHWQYGPIVVERDGSRARILQPKGGAAIRDARIVETPAEPTHIRLLTATGAVYEIDDANQSVKAVREAHPSSSAVRALSSDGTMLFANGVDGLTLSTIGGRSRSIQVDLPGEMQGAIVLAANPTNPFEVAGIAWDGTVASMHIPSMRDSGEHGYRLFVVDFESHLVEAGPILEELRDPQALRYSRAGRRLLLVDREAGLVVFERSGS